MTGLDLRPTPRGTRIAVRAVPRASRSALEGVRDGRLVVRVTPPPAEGAANEAVARTLAAALSLPPSAVVVVVGRSHRLKTVEVAGLSPAEIRRRLAPSPGE